jgi:hypothetical protein
MSRAFVRAGSLARLRAGEVVAGLGGAGLLTFTGRREVPLPRWLALLTGLSGSALAYFQASRRAPALPATLSVVVTVLGGASVLTLLARAAVDQRASSRRPHAYLGFIAALATAGGGYASMRQEGGTDPAQLGELETITLAP